MGDTLVAIPALRLVAAAFPHARRVLLSNQPVSSVAQPAASVLDGLGLFHDTASYASPGGLTTARNIYRAVRALRPDVVVSISSRPDRLLAVRDAVVFRLAGATQLYGLDLQGRELRTLNASTAMHEREASRLARLLRRLGTVDWSDPSVWQIQPQAQDHAAADAAVPGWSNAGATLCMAVGTKCPANDWGQDRWLELVRHLARHLPDTRLACIGAPDDRERSQQLLALWPGPVANFCGQLAVRETAAVLSKCRLLVGHDSGPLHLAAAVDTKTVAIFSRRNPLGKWFPLGDNHHVIYSEVPCAGCGLVVCQLQANLCTRKITVEQVAEEILRRIDRAGQQRSIA